MPAIKKGSLVSYADATTLINWNKEFESLSAENKININSLHTNYLKVNSSKTNILFFGFTPIAHENNLVRSTKFLGIHENEDMSWDVYLDAVCKKTVIFMF